MLRIIKITGISKKSIVLRRFKGLRCIYLCLNRPKMLISQVNSNSKLTAYGAVRCRLGLGEIRQDRARVKGKLIRD